MSGPRRFRLLKIGRDPSGLCSRPNADFIGVVMEANPNVNRPDANPSQETRAKAWLDA
jgi:hypothetical protein